MPKIRAGITGAGRIILLVVVICLFHMMVCPIFSAEEGGRRVIYVNNLTGNDNYDGLQSQPGSDGRAGPFATIGKAFASVNVSERIEIANTGKPYKGSHGLDRVGGTAAPPLVVNGNGAFISGLDAVPKAKWKEVGNGIVATAFWPMSNM